MNKNALIWIVVAIAIIAGGALWYFSQANAGAGAEYGAMSAQDQNASSSGAASGPGEPASTTSVSATPSQTVTVTYDGSAFNPSTITIHTGDTVMFVDSSANPIWVASGVHPSHTVYDGTDRATHCALGYSGPTPFDECQASTAAYSFTFTKAGSWPFHDHLDPSATGEVIVE